MTRPESLFDRQKKVCDRYGAAFVPSPLDQKAGVARNVRTATLPLNGMRVAPATGTTGWYIWAGEVLETRDDFFEPVHVQHLEQISPSVLEFLALPPGWRFLIAGDYVDVWFDPNLNLSS